MLSAVCGPFSELEGAFIKRLQELCAQGPANALPRPIAVVTPSRRMAERLERLAAVERGLPLINVSFHTFFSLALLVLEDAGFPDKTMLSDPLLFDRLMDAVLDENPTLARSFGGAARPKALARGLRASLRDLIDAGVDPGEVLEHFGEELAAGVPDRKKLTVLLRLAGLYQERQDAMGLLSSSSLTRMAAQRVEESPELLGHFSEILYYGFYDLTGLQMDFFEAVAKNRPATLFFPYRKNHPAFHFADKFFEQKILGLAADVRHLEPKAGRTVLGPAIDRIFAPEAAGQEAPLNRDIRIMSASGARDEIWLCAKEIIALVEGGTCRYEDVGVMARSLEPYRAALIEVFEENAIPYSLEAPEPLLRHPLAKAAWTILSAKRRDFPARILEELFASPYFKLEPGALEGRTHRWRILIKRLQIRAGWLQWEGKLKDRMHEDFLVKNTDDEVLFTIVQDEVKALWETVAALNTAFSGSLASWDAAVQAVSELVTRFLCLPGDASQAERFAFEAVLGIIASLKMFDRLSDKPSWDDVLEVLEEKFKKAKGHPPKDCRGVRVIDVMAGRGESFKVLFLMGLKEKSFPREVREDPLLRDAERSFLRHPVGCWVGLKSGGYEEERLLFHLAAASAQKKLYCVYPRSDEAGKAEVPSFYLLQLARAAGISWNEEMFYRRAARSPGQKIAECPLEQLAPREISLRLVLDGQNPAPYLIRTGRGEEAALAAAGLALMPRFSAWNPPGSLDGLVGSPKDYVRELLRRGLSPSALKTFLDCPFQFFAERVLDLGAVEEASDKDAMDKKARGKIYHKILERFYKNLAAEVNADKAWEKYLDKSIERVFGENSWRVMGLYPILWESEKRVMTDYLRAFAAWDLESAKIQGWRPTAFEEDIRAPWPGDLPDELSDLFLHGRLDRLDVDASGRRFRVVDYKTRISVRLKKEKKVQLSFYAELAENKFSPAARFESARIFGIESASPRWREDSYVGEDWQKDREAFWAAAGKSLAQLAQGRFPISPDDKGDGGWGHCAWCGFSSLCRKNHGPSRHRAQLALGLAPHPNPLPKGEGRGEGGSKVKKNGK